MKNNIYIKKHQILMLLGILVFFVVKKRSYGVEKHDEKNKKRYNRTKKKDKKILTMKKAVCKNLFDLTFFLSKKSKTALMNEAEKSYPNIKIDRKHFSRNLLLDGNINKLIEIQNTIKRKNEKNKTSKYKITDYFRDDGTFNDISFTYDFNDLNRKTARHREISGAKYAGVCVIMCFLAILGIDPEWIFVPQNETIINKIKIYNIKNKDDTINLKILRPLLVIIILNVIIGLLSSFELRIVLFDAITKMSLYFFGSYTLAHLIRQSDNTVVQVVFGFIIVLLGLLFIISYMRYILVLPKILISMILRIDESVGVVIGIIILFIILKKIIE